MQTLPPADKPAPLKNVANFSTLIQTVVERAPYLPGLACFYGHSGLGKSRSAVFGAGRYRATYVECGQYTSAKSLLESILKELGVAKPRGSIPNLIDQAIYILAADPTRPLIIDEAHWIAAKRFVDLVRELHDKSTAPVILIGEETLPRQLEAYERVHNRMLVWQPALPCDLDDFWALAKATNPGLQIAPDLAQRILKDTHGNTRRILTNLAQAAQIAARKGIETVSSDAMGALVGVAAPAPRRAA
ncbi:AAA family ATPase [Hansschlegelia zhihuaiae]|uniref:ATP-binding protein n=1 Tax=Hansschlegelia zhihuaiae TaxID=405005 RepID=A0A4Q0MNF9_9HYPH|nr:ATP-binding protein [Hansschlegelia zhihuaiae]RXF75045.1 ATP-binding protein [Hansschlegelia zhihuaiae]